jgi:hypothetical protein
VENNIIELPFNVSIIDKKKKKKKKKKGGKSFI